MIAVVVLVALAVAFGAWLWSVRSVDDPIDAAPVDAYAVVVSSPACTGSGSTAIDLNLSPVVRSSISACGRRVGERLAVQYLAGHPEQARLAGTTVAHNSSAARWLPIAIVGAGLLAVLGTVSLLFDRRPSRHDTRSGRSGPRLTVSQLRAGAKESTGTEHFGTGTASAETGDDLPVTGDAVQATGDPVGAIGDRVGVTRNGIGMTGDDVRVTGDAVGSTDDQVEASASLERTYGTVATDRGAGAVPPAATAVTGSSPFRAADIALDDELFTHRGQHLG